MEIETLSCPVCYVEFNQTDHLPRVIPSCGHTVCSACLIVLLKTSDGSKCPLDKTQFSPQLTKLDLFPPNFILNQLISNHIAHELCTVHNEPMRLVCMADKCLVCDDCVYEGVHKGHDVKPIKKFKTEIDKKRNTLENSLEQLDSHSRQLVNLLEQGRSSMISIVEERFNKLKLAISQKELEFSYEINSFFNGEKDKVNRLYGSDSSLRTEMADKISKQKNFMNGKNFFEIVEEDIASLVNTFNQAISRDCVAKLSDDISSVSKVLDNKFASQSDPLAQWQFSIKEHLANLNAGFEACKDCKTEESLMKIETYLSFIPIGDTLNISIKDTRSHNVVLRVDEWKKLKIINLELQHFELIENELQTLYYTLNKLDCVPCLQVKFSGTNVTDEDLFKAFPIFSKLESLNELEINLEKHGVSDKSLVFFAEQVMSKMTGLQRVNLKLWKTNITNSTLKAISSTSLSSLAALKHFKLCLRGTRVNNEGLQELYNALPNGLESIDINLMETDTGDASLKVFAESMLPRMKKLQSLEMLFWKTVVSDEGIIGVFNNAKDVKKLILNLDSTGVSDKSVEMFVNEIAPKMKVLKELKMNLNNTQVSSECCLKVKEFSKKLSN